MCTEHCPAGYFESIVGGIKECATCSFDCSTYVGESDKCTACKNNLYLYCNGGDFSLTLDTVDGVCSGEVDCLA